MLRSSKKSLLIFLLLSLLSCDKEDAYITPQEGYNWPNNERNYWPTDAWQMSAPEEKGLDSDKLELANQFANNDPLMRALLVVKDGYLVYEKYYRDGGINQSTNLWSVTKSISSALVGMLIDDGIVSSTQQLMADLMPDYPEYENISLHHILTQTTGLYWSETGPQWVAWILSDDWVSTALARGYNANPGEQFYYSSGNSHFLTALVEYKTGSSVDYAMNRLFDPLGILFKPLSEPIVYSSWDEYILPLSQTWRQDPNGIITASFGLYLTARDMAKFGFLYLNKGNWDGQSIVSEQWVEKSTKDYETNIYTRYSYGYQWWITLVNDVPVFLASGFGGQIIGVAPSLDMVVVLKYEAENPVHPIAGTNHDDMYLFELVVKSVK